jgi:hypothetical protein
MLVDEIGKLDKEESMMEMVKIQIPDREECAKGFAALIRRGRVDCYPDNTFIIPEPGLQALRDLGVSFIELGRGGLDYAQKALRDSSAAPAQ